MRKRSPAIGTKVITAPFGRPNFFDRFRIVAAEFLSYSIERETINPIYDDCPNVCVQGGRRTEYCDSCEILAARDSYKERAEEQLAEHAKENHGRGVKYDFQFLNRCVIDARTFEDLPPERLTVTAAEMVRTLEGERHRIKRVRDWNEKQKDG